MCTKVLDQAQGLERVLVRASVRVLVLEKALVWVRVLVRASVRVLAYKRHTRHSLLSRHLLHMQLSTG